MAGGGGINAGLVGGISTPNALTINKYLPGLPAFVNKRHKVWGRIKNAGRRVEFAGQQVIWAANIGNNEASMPLNEGEPLPTPGTIIPINFSSRLAYYYSRARMTKQDMLFANRTGSFAPETVKQLDSSRDTLIERLAVDALYGTGYGDRGQVASYSGTTLTMVANTVKGGMGNRFLKRGMQVQSWSALSGGSQGANHVLIGAVPPGGATATVPGGAGFNTSDYIFLSRTASVDPRGKSYFGLGAIVDDGTLASSIFGLSRSTYPELKAIVQGNSGTLRAWSPEGQNALMSSICQDGASSGRPTFLLSQRYVIDRAAAYLWPDRRGNFDTMTLPFGYKAVRWTDPEIGEMPWIDDREARPHCVMAVNEDDLGWAFGTDVDYERWGSNDVWNRCLDDTHAFEATLYTFRALLAGFEGYGSHGKYDDISPSL